MKKHLKYNLKLIFNTSILIFLFILFFRPFDANFENVNNLILFFAGFGGIVFILNSITLIALPAIMPKSFKLGKWEVGPPFLLNALIVVLNSVAFPFYLRFVGRTHITFHIVIKMVLIHLSSVIILRLIYIIKYQSHHLYSTNSNLSEKNFDVDDKKANDIILLFSENKAEKLKLDNSGIYFIKASDNYVEIYFQQNNHIQKKLLRNTLKNIESQLSEHKNYVRCHRTFIVNLIHVNKISKNYKGSFLKILNTEEEIPVSRHYLLKVQETLDSLL